MQLVLLYTNWYTNCIIIGTPITIGNCIPIVYQLVFGIIAYQTLILEYSFWCNAIQDLPWRHIWSIDNLVEVLNEYITFTYRSCEVRHLSLDLDPMVTLTNWIRFFFFWIKLLIWPPVLVCCFGGFLRLGNFHVCGRLANGTTISKGSSSSSVANYPQISISL